MKSAILIVAHGNFDMLKFLIKTLDYKNNDMYIHIDKKCGEIDYSQFENVASHSVVKCVRERISVSWGGVSLVKATFKLLKEAIRGGQNENRHYDYFHLISGVDFPLFSNEEMETFLMDNVGREFIGFGKRDEQELLSKLGYYHIFSDGASQKVPCSARLHFWLLRLQKILHIKQYKDIAQFSKGCEWCTITERLVKALIKEEQNILKKYKYTSCSDEIFIQTFVVHHPEFASKVYNYDDEYEGCMRLIDWNRGKPYTFTNNDFEELLASKRFFARKFGSLKVLQEFVEYKMKLK